MLNIIYFHKGVTHIYSFLSHLQGYSVSKNKQENFDYLVVIYCTILGHHH